MDFDFFFSRLFFFLKSETEYEVSYGISLAFPLQQFIYYV